MNGALNEYAKALAPTQAQERMYNEAAQILGKRLHENSRLKFQIRPAGSFMKKSGIAGKMDLDIVVLINDLRPPFESVLSDFEDILLKISDLNERDIQKSRFSLQFLWPCRDQEIDIDLVMAANLIKDTTNVYDVCSEQHRLILEEIKKFRNRRGELDPFEGSRYYSGSFTEPTIEFVKAQSASVHNLIRLVKMWKNSLFFSKPIYGLSSTLEAIAIFVGMEMEKKVGDAFSLADALEQFFQTMINLRNVRIVFSRENMQSYRRGRAFYSSAQIPPEVLRQKPLVLDPVDPFNNRLHGRNFDTDFFDILSKKAGTSLKILRSAEPSDATSAELFNSVVKTIFVGPFCQTGGTLWSINMVHVMPYPKSAIGRSSERISKTTLVRRRSDPTKDKYAEFCLNMYDMVVKSKKAFNEKKRMPTQSVYAIVREVLEHTVGRKFVSIPDFNENDYDYCLKLPSEDGVVRLHFKW